MVPDSDHMLPNPDIVPKTSSGNHIARELWFTGPSNVEIRSRRLDPPGPGQARVRALISGISSGTECLAYRGEIPPDLILDETQPDYVGNFHYPFRYGYALVGEIIELGPDLDSPTSATNSSTTNSFATNSFATNKKLDNKVRPGMHVFAFHPHASLFNISIDSLIPIPKNIEPQRALFFANMETAVNLVLDGSPVLGERVAVIGQGIVGLLTSSVLARFPLDELLVIDSNSRRAQLGIKCGASRIGWPQDSSKSELIFECTGNPACIQQAIDHADHEARIVIASWYGNKPVALDLGQRFHRSRLRLISSQVSHLPGALGPRWNRQRRSELVWSLLAASTPEHWISHRIPLDDASSVYAQLASPDQTSPVQTSPDQNRLFGEDPLQVVFDYNA